MRPMRLSLLVLAVFLALGGFGPGALRGLKEARAQAPARDLSKLDLCKLVKPAEVANAAGGQLATEPSWNGKACMYVIETASDTESYLLSVDPAALVEAMLDYQSAEEKGEKIAGLWDEAWLSPRAMGKGFTLLVLRRGDISLEASGDRREVVLAIGKLAAGRIK